MKAPTVSISLGSEPTLIIQTLVAILTAAQLTLLAAPSWLHGALAAAVIGLGAILNRSQVSPVSAPSASPVPPAV